MPQLDFISYLPQIFWVSILFIVFFVGLTRGFLPVLSRVFWFREFKKLSFVSDVDIVSCFLFELYFERVKLVRFVSFCSAVNFYFSGCVYKNTSILKKVWLNLKFFFLILVASIVQWF
jgi:hypothetical protein